MVFLDRRPRKDDPWLDLKVWAFTIGAALAMGGIYFDSTWLIWAAIAVLAVGFGARFLPDSDSGESSAEKGRRERG